MLYMPQLTTSLHKISLSKLPGFLIFCFGFLEITGIYWFLLEISGILLEFSGILLEFLGIYWSFTRIFWNFTGIF